MNWFALVISALQVGASGFELFHGRQYPALFYAACAVGNFAAMGMAK